MNFRDPQPYLEKQVRVYRNLTKNCLSIQYKGLVVGHAQSVTLRNARFVVRQSGYERFLKEHRKNVHAFVVGILFEIDGPKPEGLNKLVSYNPKRSNLFHTVENCFKGRQWFFSDKESFSLVWICSKTIVV